MRRFTGRLPRKLRQVKVAFNPQRGIFEPVILEEHVVQEIVKRLFQAQIHVDRINQPVGGKVRQNVAGISDLVGCIPQSVLANTGGGLNPLSAMPLYIEVKRPKGNGHRAGVRSPAQIQFIADRKRDGCAAFFADSWADVVRELDFVGVKLQP